MAVKRSGHSDPGIFSRYNIVDTRCVTEAMRKLSMCEQEKRLARSKRALDVHTSFTEPVAETKKPILPDSLQ